MVQYQAKSQATPQWVRNVRYNNDQILLKDPVKRAAYIKNLQAQKNLTQLDFQSLLRQKGYKIDKNARFGQWQQHMYDGYVKNGYKFDDEVFFKPRHQELNNKELNTHRAFQKKLRDRGFKVDDAWGNWQQTQYDEYVKNGNRFTADILKEQQQKEAAKQRARQIAQRPSVSTELTNNIKSWQQRLGVAQDGIWGKNTEAAYQNYLKNHNTINTNTQSSTNQTATNPPTTTSIPSTQTPTAVVNNNQDRFNPMPTAFNYVDSDVTQYYPQHQAGNTIVDILKYNNHYV